MSNADTGYKLAGRGGFGPPTSAVSMQRSYETELPSQIRHPAKGDTDRFVLLFVPTWASRPVFGNSECADYHR